MNDDALTRRTLDILKETAPDMDEAELDPKINFRDQFEFDSVDCLNFCLALEKAFGIEIPETDYPRLTNLNGALAYLKEKGAG